MSFCFPGLSCDAVTAYSTLGIALATSLTLLAAAIAAFIAYRSYKVNTAQIISVSRISADERFSHNAQGRIQLYNLCTGATSDGTDGLRLLYSREDTPSNHPTVAWYVVRSVGAGVVAYVDIAPLILGPFRRKGAGLTRLPTLEVEQGSVKASLLDGPVAFGLTNSLSHAISMVVWRNVRYRTKFRKTTLAARGPAIQTNGECDLVGLNGESIDDALQALYGRSRS